MKKKKRQPWKTFLIELMIALLLTLAVIIYKEHEYQVSDNYYSSLRTEILQ